MSENKDYGFNEESVVCKIEQHWRNFMTETHSTKCVIGISGGIDSTCVAALACRIFGKENVIGISLPCDGQKDMTDVNSVFEHLGFGRIDFDIGNCFHDVLNGVENNAIGVSETTRINLPARLRMASLYAFSQSITGSLVINTCNLSETEQGYDTIFGDDCGSYAPIKNLTKTEVRKIARYLGVPESLVTKIPIDGLQDKSDEERFGYSYETLDNYIRLGIGDVSVTTKILKRYFDNKFKIEMINIKGPEFGFPDHISNRNA